MDQLLEDADAFDRGAAFVDWLGAHAASKNEPQKADDCARKASDLRALAGLYREAAGTTT